jgi:hypothetical protein
MKPTLERVRLPVAWFSVLVSSAGLGASGTGAYLGLRGAMVETGAFCARGGPYEIASECEGNSFALLAGSIVALLVFAGLHAAFTAWAGGPQVGVFAICGALLLALGWNFVDLGLDRPGEGGRIGGWLVAGVTFWVLGTAFMVPVVMRAIGWLRRGGEPEPPAFGPAQLRVLSGGWPAPTRDRPAPSVPTRLVLPDRPAPGGGR